MSLPKEPRQKMINMMYLVLTALLALNVSAEILNAFRTVDRSLKNANDIIELKNEGLFKSFERKMADAKTAEKAKIWHDKAAKAKSFADQLFSYIENLKTDLMKGSGLDAEGHYKEDDIDTPTRMLVEGNRGKELLQKLGEYKQNLLNIDPELAKEFANTLPIDLSVPKTEHAGNSDWASAYFRMTPTVASITMLSKFQNDVRNSEAQVVDFCHRKVGEVEIVYDQFAAFAGTNSQYLMPGQELVITAGIGAFSKAAKPSISVDGAGMSLNAQGVAEYKTSVGGPGSYSKRVVINFVKPDGSPAQEIKEIQYTVGSPTGASVSADKVNVLYIGLENPLTISGGSAGAEKTQASITSGNLRNLGGGKYIATVSSPGETTVNVSVDGKTTPFRYRVKNVPKPTPMVGQSEGGRVPANVLKSQQGVRADLKDFVFEGVKFDVVGFIVYATGAGFLENPGYAANGGSAYFNGEAKKILEKCRPGSTVVIDEIKAVGPGGGTVKLPPLVYTLY